jgi:NCS2 family nucleobase:cation symporter-2
MRPPNLIYSVEERPPWGEALALGLQHAAFAAAGLVTARAVASEAGAGPHEVIAFVTLTALACGIATLLISLDTRLAGSGYFCAAISGPAFFVAAAMAARSGGLALVCGMTLMAGLCQIFLARALPRLRDLFPPEVVGLVALMVGYTALRFAVPLFLGYSAAGGINGRALIVAVVTLAVMIAPIVWLGGRWRLYAVLGGLGVGYLLSAALGLFNPSDAQALGEAPWAALPPVASFGWDFDSAMVLPFLVAVLCATLKGVSDLTICQMVNDARWERMAIGPVSGGITGLGIGNAVAGLAGGMGLATSSGNVGLSVLSGATSRVLAFVMGGVLIALAFLPKFAALFLCMPAPVLGACLILATVFMLVAALQIMGLRPLDMRRIFVIGISLSFALSIDVMPQLYRDLPRWIAPFFDSSLAAGTVLAIALNALLRFGMAHTVEVIVPAGRNARDVIAPALTERGKAHGARKDVLDLAVTTVAGTVERLRADGLAPGDVTLRAFFDEFAVDIEVLHAPAAHQDESDATVSVRLHFPQ